MKSGKENSKFNVAIYLRLSRDDDDYKDEILQVIKEDEQI